MTHAYPAELAQFVRARWDDVPGGAAPCAPLPPPADLEELLSVAYQATLLRDEERAVVFRLIVGAPELFPSGGGPPQGLHRLSFIHPRPYSSHELRRLAPAVKYARSLIGVRAADRGFEIWGILHSGPRWLQSAQGGRAIPPESPGRLLVVRGIAPGRLAVDQGGRTVAELRGGAISIPVLDVFSSAWLASRFDDVRGELAAIYAAQRAQSEAPTADLDPNFTRLLTQQMIKRMLSTIRSMHHGGTILIVPPDCGEQIEHFGRFLHMKYAFGDLEPRQRYRTLLVSVVRALAARAGAGGTVGWSDYQSSTSAELSALDEAVFEMSNLIAGLADVDGAVVLTKRFELLGFAAEIAGDLPETDIVYRALDLEGERREPEATDGVGTRHRSAYRLCAKVHGAIAIVVSQDGGVRFIAWHNGAVTYWNHVPAGAL